MLGEKLLHSFHDSALLCAGTKVQLIDSNPEMEELHQQQGSVTNFSVII
jgi:hypothetical protein